MKKQLLFSLIFVCLSSWAISQTRTTNFHVTYKLKLQGIDSPGAAKNASMDLGNLFDSSHQTYSISDSIITIRSSFDANESILVNKLSNYGYPVLFFSKKYDLANPIEDNQSK